MKVTGKFAEDVRKKLGIAQGQLAREAGLHQTTLSRVESSRDKLISDDHWARLRDAFFSHNVRGLDLADQSRETDEDVFVRKGDDGTVSVVSLKQSSGGEITRSTPRADPETAIEDRWIPFTCRLPGQPPVARLQIQSTLTTAEMEAVKKWLSAVERAAVALTEVDIKGNGDD